MVGGRVLRGEGGGSVVVGHGDGDEAGWCRCGGERRLQEGKGEDGGALEATVTPGSAAGAADGVATLLNKVF